MKTKKHATAAAKVSLRLANRKGRELIEQLQDLPWASRPQARMPRIMAALAELNQHVYEYNAYANLAETP